MIAVSDFNGVEVYDAFDIDDEVRIEISGEWRWLQRGDVRELRDHLNTLLGDAPAAKAETVVRGREYRLLPDSRYVNGDGTVFIDDHTTRVRVMRGRDSDGDVYVKAIDGDDPGFSAHVDPKYLAPLSEEPAKPSPDVAAAAWYVAEYYALSGTSTANAISDAFRKLADTIREQTK